MLHNGLLNLQSAQHASGTICPSSGARDYTGDYSMWHMTL